MKYMALKSTVSGKIISVHEVVGETKVYYKVRINESLVELIRKDTLRPRGAEKEYCPITRYCPMSEDDVKDFAKRRKIIKFLEKIDFSELETVQLEKIYACVYKEIFGQ